MHEGITLLTAVWLVAFASTIARAVRDGDRDGMLRVAGLGGTAGFLAVGIVALWSGRGSDGGLDADYWFSIGLASIIGGFGKEQDKIRVIAWNMLTQAVRSIDSEKKP